MVVYKGVPFINGSTYLCAKLCRCFGLASDDRTDMWLENADYAIFALMSLLIKHLQLLRIHIEGCSEDALLMGLQKIFASLILYEEFCKFAEVLAQIAQHS